MRMVLLLSTLILSGCGEWLYVDRCLDNGGAWDYTNKVCSTECISDGHIWNDETKICEFE